jgi:hypothetical protein
MAILSVAIARDGARVRPRLDAAPADGIEAVTSAVHGVVPQACPAALMR